MTGKRVPRKSRQQPSRLWLAPCSECRLLNTGDQPFGCLLRGCQSLPSALAWRNQTRRGFNPRPEAGAAVALVAVVAAASAVTGR
jgi:hypothetical protein